MYAFVDVAQYQIVVTGQTIDEAKRNYRETLGQEEIESDCQRNRRQAKTVSGTVEAIENVVVSGNTCYYFTLTDDRTDSVYTAAITVSERLPFVQEGDSVFPLSASRMVLQKKL